MIDPSDPRDNPYAAPREAEDPQRGAKAAGREWTTWAYAAVAALTFVLCVIIRFNPWLLQLGSEPLHAMARLVDGVLRYTSLGLALIWVYAAFGGVPRLAREVSPGLAAGRCVIPFYNLWWMFAAQTLLCDALDDDLRRAGNSQRAPRDLARVAPAFYLAGSVASSVMTLNGGGMAFIFVAIAQLGWIAYAFRYDAVRRLVPSR